MKKLSIMLLVFVVLLTACTPKKPVTSDPSPSPIPTPVVRKADIKDKSSLHQYVKNEIADVSWEQFAEWHFLYCDITRNGSEDVVLLSPNVEWHDKVEIISVNGGQFTRVESDIPLTRHINTVTHEDGFLVVRGSTGGPKEGSVFIDLYVYSDQGMKGVLAGLLIEHTVSSPTASYEQKAVITGGLHSFIYTLTEYDKMANTTSMVKKARYIYDPYTETFLVRPAIIAQGPGVFYLHQLSNGASVGRGLTITDIEFKPGSDSAAFNLLGDLEVKGRLLWDDKDGSGLVFVIDESETLPVLLIEFGFETLEYSPRLLYFSNNDAVNELVTAKVIEEIRNGTPLKTKMKLTDIRVGLVYGTCAGRTTCVFVSMDK